MASSLDPRRPPPFPHRLRMQQLPSDLDDYHDGGGGGFVANTNTASTNTTTTTTASNYEITQLEDDPLDYGDVEAGIAAHLDSGDSIEAVVAAAVTERNSLRTQNEQMWKIIEKQRTIIQQMTDERTKDREEIARLRDLLSATAVAATDDVIAATTATTATASTTSTTSTTSGARQGDTASTGADPTTYHDSKKQGVSFQLFGEAVPASPGQKGQPLKPGTAVGSTTALHGLETLKVDDKGTKNTADPHNSVEEPDSTSSKKVNVNRLSKTRLSMRISEDDAKLYNMYFSAILDSDSSALDLASSLFTPPPSKQTVFDDSVSIADVHDIGEKGDESKTLVETVGGEGAENSEPNDSEDDNDDEAGDSEDLEAEAQDTLKPLPPLQMPERMPLPPIPGSSSPADASPRSVHNVQMPPQRLMARSSSETYSPESFQASRPTDLRLSSVSLNYPQPSQSSRGVEYDSSGAPRHFPGSHPLPTPPSTLSSRSTSEPSLVINTANGASGNYPGGVPPLRMQSGLPPPPLPARESSLTGCSFTVVSSRPLSDRTMSFTIYVQSTDSWSVDRTAADFSALDAKVRSNPRTPLTKALPALEKSVFTTYTPLKFDQRKGYIEQYLRRLIEYEKDSREISEFLGINLNQPQRRSGHNSSDSLIIKEGFLHKKNKGLATWKARYYRCKAAILECYDDPMSKDVVASIKLRHCLLTRIPLGGDSNFPFAFALVEYKSGSFNDSDSVPPESKVFARHILAAANEGDREEWFRILSQLILEARPPQATNSIASSVQAPRSLSLTSDGSSPLSQPPLESTQYPRPSSLQSRQSFNTPSWNSTLSSSPSGYSNPSAAGSPYGNSYMTGSPQMASGGFPGGAFPGLPGVAPPPVVGGGGDPLAALVAAAASSGSKPPSRNNADDHQRAMQQHPVPLPLVDVSWVQMQTAQQAAMLAQQMMSSGGVGGSSGGATPGSGAGGLAVSPGSSGMMPFGGAAVGDDGSPMAAPNMSPRNLSVGGLRGAQAGVNKMVSSALNWGRKRGGPDTARHMAGLPSRAVFGLPLEQAVALTRISDTLELPAIVYRCIDYLLVMKALDEEGIYRLSGSSTTVQLLKEKFNTEGDVDLVAGEPYDVHAVAGVLKLFLRELPMPILTQHLQRDFTMILELEDRNDRISELATLLSMLPSANYTLLRILCSHLVEVVQRSDVNKMTVRNVGIVFSPTLGIPVGLFGLMLAEFDAVFALPYTGGGAAGSGEGPAGL